MQVFVLQAQYMDRRVDVNGRALIIPAASMTVFDTIAIVVMIPIYDGIVQPLMKTLRCELSLLQRIGWGFVLAALAMVSAGIVERNRMRAIADGSNVSVMQQVTPYLLVGASEVLSSIGQIEFFYDQVQFPCVFSLIVVSAPVTVAVPVFSYSTYYFFYVRVDLNSQRRYFLQGSPIAEPCFADLGFLYCSD